MMLVRGRDHPATTGELCSRREAEVLPNLIVIGAGKCGTSSLHRYLDLHPEISMSRPKELDFFASDMNWSRGIAWYERHFREAAFVRGESSVTYSEFPHRDGVPARMAQVIPEAKLIYLVRDPIDRIVSSYVFNVSLGYIRGPLAQALAQFENNPMVAKSRYWFQLEQYLQHFPREQLLVIDQHELREHRGETLERIFRFLAVDETFDSPAFASMHNVTLKSRGRLAASVNPRLDRLLGEARSKRIRRSLPPWLNQAFSEPIRLPIVDDELRDALRAFLRSDVERLRAFTGLPLDTWSL
jgi:sulfotransferase family protein